MWGQHACTHMQNRLCAHNPRLHKGVCVHVCIREGQGGARTSASYLVQPHLHVKQLKLAQPVHLHSPSWPTGHFCLSGNTVAVSCIWVLFLQACPPGLPSRLALQACPLGLPSRLALSPLALILLPLATWARKNPLLAASCFWVSECFFLFLS